MSYTPDVYEDQQGETHYDLSRGELTTSAPKEAIHQHNNRTHQENFYTDEDTGNIHYDNSADDNDYSNIVDSVGGVEAYQAMTAWAQNNLSAEEIAEFNELMDSGDINTTYNLVQQLAEMYHNQDASDNPEEFDDVSQYVFDNVIDREDYAEMTSYVRENFDADFIDNFNLVMDSGDVELIESTIRQLHAYIYPN